MNDNTSDLKVFSWTGWSRIYFSSLLERLQFLLTSVIFLIWASPLGLFCPVTCLPFPVSTLSCPPSHRMICRFKFFSFCIIYSTVSSPVICTFHPSATSAPRPTQFNPSGRRAELDVFHINKWLPLSCGHYLGYMQILFASIHPCTSCALIRGIKAKTAGRTEGMEWFYFFVLFLLCWFSVGHASYCGTMNINEKVTQKDLHTLNGPLCKYGSTLRFSLFLSLSLSLTQHEIRCSTQYWNLLPENLPSGFLCIVLGNLPNLLPVV